MNYDFDSIVSRFGTYTLKYDDDVFFRAITPGIRLDRNTIRLQLADMDFKCAPAITEAMHRTADFGTFGYTSPDSEPEYKNCVVRWYRKRYGLELKSDWIIHSNGALDGVGRTIEAFSDPGDGVVICRPVYNNFTSTIQRLGRKVVDCRMVQPSVGDYRIDWEGFEAACAAPENKVYILCSPQNPVGRVWTPGELNRMAGICRRNNVVIVSDEIHSDIVRSDVRHTPILKAVEDKSNIIMVSGASKSFNLMGLQCAYSVIMDDKLRKKFVTGYHTESPTAFAIAGLIAAYDESGDWLDELNAYLDEMVIGTVNRIREKLPKAKAYVPEGTYILWVDFGGYGFTYQTLHNLVNHRANVSAQRGLAHDPEGGEQYLRLCLTSPKAVVYEAIDRIAEAFTEYEQQNG